MLDTLRELERAGFEVTVLDVQAAQIADASRARMLAHLLSGDCATAGEPARAASVTPATASGHLARLLDAGFVVCELAGHASAAHGLSVPGLVRAPRAPGRPAATRVAGALTGPALAAPRALALTPSGHASLEPLARARRE